MLRIEVKAGRTPDIQVIVLVGEFDINETDGVQDALSRSGSRALRGVIFDLAGISVIDSSAIGLMIAHQAYLRERGVRMAVIIDNNNYLMRKLNHLNIFSTAGIEVFENTEQAELAFRA